MPFLQRFIPFRIFKFRTTLAEELEDLHTESNNLQQALIKTRARRQKWTKWFAIDAILIHLIGNFIYYFFFLSDDNIVRTYAVFFSIILAVVTYAIHWLIRYYFRTYIQMKEDRLESFKIRKQELIDQVKKKETYAVAKTLLEKFDESAKQETPRPTPVDSDRNELRQRVSIRVGPTSPQMPTNIGRLEIQNKPTPQIRLPRPILEPQQTWWDSLLGAIVGDGPSKRFICDDRLHERWKFRFRYALICKSCQCHNGMSLEEEFQYLSFRCAYCNYFNSSRKEKPTFNGNSHELRESNDETLRSAEISPQLNGDETSNENGAALPSLSNCEVEKNRSGSNSNSTEMDPSDEIVPENSDEKSS